MTPPTPPIELLDGRWHCTRCDRSWASGDEAPEPYCECGGIPFMFGGIFHKEPSP